MSDPNYLVRVLKGRDSFNEPSKAKADQPVEMPPEEDDPYEAGPPEVVHQPNRAVPPDTTAEEKARQQAEAARLEVERQAERAVKQKARDERNAAREARRVVREARRLKNARIRAKRRSRLESLLPKPLSFLSVSSSIQTRITSLALTAKSGRAVDVRRLASAYESAGFSFVDLPAAMNGHFEEEAIEWSAADPVDAWINCNRADWLTWVCSGVAGWGYPGLWPAASDCVRQAIAVASSRMPKEVVKFLTDTVKDLDFFIASWRSGKPDLSLIDDLHRATKKLIENISAKLDKKPDLAISLKAAEAVRALISLDPLDRPPVDAIVRAAAVLAAAIPERAVMPDSWLPDDAERAAKWTSDGRPRAEIKAKLAFLSPLVRKRIPVPVAP